MIFVAGATGSLGGRIVRKLLAGGKTLRIIGKDPSPSAEMAPIGLATSAASPIAAGAELVTGDLTDQASLDAACASVETVFTTAAATKRADDIEAVDLNGTLNKLLNLRDSQCHSLNMLRREQCWQHSRFYPDTLLVVDAQIREDGSAATASAYPRWSGMVLSRMAHFIELVGVWASMGRLFLPWVGQTTPDDRRERIWGYEMFYGKLTTVSSLVLALMLRSKMAKGWYLPVILLALVACNNAGKMPEAPLFVVHEKGGNMFLYVAPELPFTDVGAEPTDRPGAFSNPPGMTPQPSLTNHANYWSPAWIYELEGFSPNQVTSVSFEKPEGLTATLVLPGCVVPLQPVDYQQSGPADCLHIDPWEALQTELPDSARGDRNYTLLRIEADPTAPPGPQRLTVEWNPNQRRDPASRDLTPFTGQPGRSVSGSRSSSYLIHVANTGTALLAQATYVHADGRRDPIRLDALRNGAPLIGGLMSPASLQAPAVELQFLTDHPGSLKFAAPDCLLASDLEVHGPRVLIVTARLKVPERESLPTSGVVGSRSELPSASCSWVLYDPILDKVRDSVQHEGTALGNFTLLSPSDTFVRIRPKFLTIAGMGDSYAAGEGAPDSYNPTTKRATWEEEQCHRSANSRLTKGVEKIAEIPGVWVLYKNFACSGATIYQGIIGHYNGLPPPYGDPPRKVIDPQIDQLELWLSGQELDALLLSVGGNDIGFGEVVTRCLNPLFFDCVHDKPLLGNDPPLHQLVAQGDNTVHLVGLDNLQDAYELLNEYIEGRIGETTVFILDYPDPLRFGGKPDASLSEATPFLCNGYQNFDDHFVVGQGHISHGDLVPSAIPVGAKIANLKYAEIQWIYANVLRPLNGAVLQAADRLDWQHVSGFVEHSYDHGFCVYHSYVNTLLASWHAQGDVFGTVHPTREAYDLYGEIVAEALGTFFQLPTRPDIVVVEQRHSQDSSHHYGTYISNPELLPESLISAKPTEFRVQIAPTRRTLTVRFEFIRKNRYSGNPLGEMQTLLASQMSDFESRIEYTVEHPLNLCETLEYRWRIQHSGSNGTRTTTTAWDSLTPEHIAAADPAYCPRE
jgi:NAD(P)-dependent dehydrogenase (short-subunit alcohol dehydrogenase family)